MKRGMYVAGSLLLALVWSSCGGPKPQPLTPEQQYTPQDIPVRQVLQYMPASAQAAFAVPSSEIVDTELASKIQGDQAESGYKKALSQLAENLKLESVESFSGLADAIGVDPAQPVAGFYTAGADMAFVVVLKDPKVFEEKLTAYAGTKFSSIVLKTNWHSFLTRKNKALWAGNDGHLGFFVKDNRAFVATSQPLLMELLARQTTPAPIAYGLGDYPGKGKPELVVLTRLGADLDAGLGFAKDKEKYLKPVLGYFAQQCDEATFTISMGSGPATLRLAAHETAPAAAEAPVPLTLHRFFPSDTLALATLRLGPGFQGLLTALGKKGNGMGDIGQQIGQAQGILKVAVGDEIAAGITGMADGKPVGLVLFPVKSQKMLTLPLTIADATAPIYTHGSVPVYKVVKYVPFPIFVGLGEKMAFVSTQENTLKLAIERAEAETAEKSLPWVAPEVLEQGPYGFATWNQELVQVAIQDISSSIMPQGLNLGGGTSYLTLDSRGGWRQATLTIANIDALLKNISLK